MMTAQAVSTFPDSVTKLGQSALHEAERILSETEPETDGETGTPTLAMLPFVGPRSSWGAGSALAESLAAVLPVLDELAQDTAFGDWDGPSLGGFDNSLIEIWRRNRATDAAMGGGQ
jgi:hypothetical protein